MIGTARMFSRGRGTGSGLIVPGVILLLAAALRFGLANYSLWFDEYASLFFAHQPFARLWSVWMVRETNPPLFYSILRGWILLSAPTGPVMLRAPAIVASLLTIVVVYRGLSRVYGVRPAAAAALLLSVSAQQIYYAQQLRGYSLFALAITISFFGLMRIVTADEPDDRHPTSAWISYVGGAIAAIYLHSTGFLWVPIATIGLMISDRRFILVFGRNWIQLAAADAAIVIGASWAIYIAYQQMLAPNPNIAWLRYQGIRGSSSLFWESTLLVRNPQRWQSFVAELILGIAVYGAIRTLNRSATRLTAACGVTALVVYFCVSLKQPIMVERTLVWLGIFPVILICAALSTIRKPALFLATSGLVATLVAINLIVVYPDFEREDWAGGLSRAMKTPNAALVISGEGGAVVAAEACALITSGRPCPVAMITLPGPNLNAWAVGYGPRTPATSAGQLALPATTQLYFTQRYSEQPLLTLHTAGLLKSIPMDPRLFTGPFGPPAVADLKRGTCVRGNLLQLACSSPPTR